MKAQVIACVGAVVLALSSNIAGAEAQKPLGVAVANNSQKQLCAEKDNVSLMLTNPVVRSFRIEAAHPLYIDTLRLDNNAPDWTACDIAPDPAADKARPPIRKTTIYEDAEVSVIGITYPTFWRSTDIPVRIGDKVQSGFAYIQVWVHAEGRFEEVLVLYPADGYWRARPLAPEGLELSAYGSSFLIGPVEDIAAPDGGTRPAVNIKLVDFDPKTKTFTLDFARGGEATVAISKIDRRHQIIDVAFDAPIAGGPFAGLRSMYVTRFNNDVADTAVLEKGADGWREDGVMSFPGAKAAVSLWAGRIAPSRHNTSSPDMVFSGFSDAATLPN